MNTAVRALPQRQFATRVESKKIAFKQIAQVVLLASLVLISAFAVVYVKDLNRRLFIDFQNRQDDQNQLYVDWGKLLLEQSTWSTQARVQTIATGRLNMEAPQGNEIVMLEK